MRSCCALSKGEANDGISPSIERPEGYRRRTVKFLLDTHCWLWLQTDRERFDADLLESLAAPTSRRYLSAASVWEIVIKHAIGKLPLPEPPAIYVPERMRVSRVRELPITHAHALAVGVLPPHHRDAFDRVLVAQAQSEGLTLVTADSTFTRYDVPLIQLGDRQRR